MTKRRFAAVSLFAALVTLLIGTGCAASSSAEDDAVIVSPEDDALIARSTDPIFDACYQAYNSCFQQCTRQACINGCWAGFRQCASWPPASGGGSQ
jgi:hypothetical protein